MGTDLLDLLTPSAGEGHGTRAHATLGASGASRWIACPGSIHLTRNLADRSSDAAREGTAAHEMAEQLLKSGEDADVWIDRKFEAYWIDAEWAEALQVYLDTCRAYDAAQWQWMIEAKFNLAPLNPPAPMFGTSDFCAYSTADKVLAVLDLKWGRGVAVDAVGNPQLKYYALGALLRLMEQPGGRDLQVDRIDMAIVQPRMAGQKVKRESVTLAELMQFGKELIEAAKRTMEPGAPLSAGKHCKFCKASGQCPEEANKSLRLAQTEFSVIAAPDAQGPVTMPDVSLLTIDQIVSVHKASSQIKAFLAAVDDTLRDALSRTGEIEGLKLVETMGHQKWSASEEAVTAKALVDLDLLTKDEVWVPKIVSPAVARKAFATRMKSQGVTKVMAEDLFKVVAADLITQNVSGTAIVPSDDARPAVGVRGSEFGVLLPAPKD